MRKMSHVALAGVALLLLVSASVFALQAGTWECMGYTITVTPDDLENPNEAGSVTITKSDDVAVVDISGRYVREEKGPRPATIVTITGTIATAEQVINVNETFAFDPGPKKTIWKTIVAWIESQVAS